MDDATIFLFGSAARGDPDEASDIDVMAVYGLEVHSGARERLKSELVRVYGDRISLAEYTWNRIDEMFLQGHLFAWHLFLESRHLPIIGSKVSAGSFAQPSPYLTGREDAMRFLALLQSTYSELNEGSPSSEVHEAGLTYLALRNIGMSLSYSHCNQPDFTRHSPFQLSQALDIPPPCSALIYDTLVKARHSSQRGRSAPAINLEELKATVKHCLAWAKTVLEKTDGKPRN